MKLFNKKLNLSSDDVLACKDYLQLKYWYGCVEQDVLEMELKLSTEGYENNDRMKSAMMLQKKLSKLIQTQIAKVDRPKNFDHYIVEVCREKLAGQWDEIIALAMDKKTIDEL